MDSHAKKPTYISLFSGVGGGDIAAQHLKGWRCVCYVERESYCQRVIRARIADGFLDDAPIWGDVRSFDGSPWRGLVDIIAAGFPCQSFSVAGKQHAAEDTRNGWPATLRLIREIRPSVVFLENVPGLLSGSHGYFGTILAELAAAGFDAEWIVLGADDVGAPHVRKRLWLVATDADRDPLWILEQRGSGRRAATICDEGPRVSGYNGDVWRFGFTPGWPASPDFYRMDDGMAHRLDRLKAIGNGQVPIVAAMAWDFLSLWILRRDRDVA
jgi:DNA (cytosine-5)-methyltransferase 1